MENSNGLLTCWSAGVLKHFGIFTPQLALSPGPRWVGVKLIYECPTLMLEGGGVSVCVEGGWGWVTHNLQ